jgi:hypothetical protein
MTNFQFHLCWFLFCFGHIPSKTVALLTWLRTFQEYSRNKKLIACMYMQTIYIHQCLWRFWIWYIHVYRQYAVTYELRKCTDINQSIVWIFSEYYKCKKTEVVKPCFNVIYRAWPNSSVLNAWILTDTVTTSIQPFWVETDSIIHVYKQIYQDSFLLPGKAFVQKTVSQMNKQKWTGAMLPRTLLCTAEHEIAHPKI